MDEMKTTGICPRAVVLAERLLWLSAGIGVLFAVLGIMDLLPLTIPGDSAASNFISGAFLALVAVKIGDGRNWARWLLLVVFVLGSLTLPFALIFAPEVLHSMPALLVVIGLAQFAIQLWALILVFMPASKAWFRPAAGESR